MRRLIPLFGFLVVVAGCRSHKAERIDRYLVLADECLARSRPDEALSFVQRAVAVDATSAIPYEYRGRIESSLQQNAKALADFNQAIQLNNRCAEAYDERGDVYFRLGRIDDAVADYDRFVHLRPQLTQNYWRRGIACYYAKRYEDAARQFAECAKADGNDIENALWYFLCMVRLRGLEAARTAIAHVNHDQRVPMAEIYSLYMGKGRPEDVLAAANAGKVPTDERRRRLFRAYLYLGLYDEVTGHPEESQAEINLAGNKFAMPDFMGDLAGMHVVLRQQQASAR